MSRSVRKQAALEGLDSELGGSQTDGSRTDLSDDAPISAMPADSWTPIEELHGHGIAAVDTKRLREGGIFTVQAILMQTKRELCQVKGLSEAKVEKLLEAARQLGGLRFLSGTEYLERRQRIIRISTGCSEFDALLGGGIETMAITEVFGEFRTGKTQLCHTLAVTAQLPAPQGGSGKVIYIDTEGTFRPERVVPIAARFGLDPATALGNIIFARAHTHEQQMELLAAAAAKMVEERYALVIIDSITALFRVDFTGRGQLAERQQTLGQHLSRLIKVADEFNIAVFITNQVMAQVDGAAMFTADPKKPIGGHILAHASTTRLYLRKGRGETRVVKVYDSPSLPEAEATYAIATEGIMDAAE